LSNESHPDVTKLRRFALTVGLLLFTYSLAGVRLETSAKITPFGFPFLISRPDLLGIGLVLASVYSAARYWYYALMAGISPARARRRLLVNNLANGRGGAMEPAEFVKQAHADVDRYLPGAEVDILPFEINVRKLPKRTRLFVRLEDLDYSAPVWVNAAALLAYSGAPNWLLVVARKFF
jgi:hypothetical protein